MNEQKQHLRSWSITTTSVIFMQQKEKKSDVLKTKATGVCRYVLGCVYVYITMLQIYSLALPAKRA